MNKKFTDISDINIIGLCGSLRNGSFTKKALTIALNACADQGAQTSLIDLVEYDLPFCDGNQNEEKYPEGVAQFRKTIKDAHGIIIGTPEYHGSYSGVLKNALDLLGFDEMEGKMIGLLCVSGGQFGGMNPLGDLRSIGRKLHAWVAPDEVAIPGSYSAFDDNGQLKNVEIKKRLEDLGKQVAKFSFLHCAEKSDDFLHLWEGAPFNPGG